MASLLLAPPTFAQDAFEVQVYDSRTAAPGAVGFEVHANTFPLEAKEAHFTIEPHLGLATWCELGLYLTTGLHFDGRYDFAGFKGRFKARWPEKLWGVVGLALNQEIAFGGGTWDDAGLEWEIRPVIDVDVSWLYASINPIVGTVLSGPGKGHSSFEPAFKAAVTVREGWAVGAEYYAAPAEATHRLFAALDVEVPIGPAQLEVNFGVGTSLSGPEKLIVKLVVALDVEPTPSAPARQ